MRARAHFGCVVERLRRRRRRRPSLALFLLPELLGVQRQRQRLVVLREGEGVVEGAEVRSPFTSGLEFLN